MPTLKLGTRGSPLALVQVREVADLLRQRAGVSTTVHVITTSGDRSGEVTLSDVGGKRLFVKEIEEALLAGEIDLGVHSSKDLPAQLPDGLDVGAALPREDPRDVIVLPRTMTAGPQIEDVMRHVGSTPRIGTSSVRRRAQLTRLFPTGSFLPIRGNLDTRLRKLDSGEFDLLVLAAAGLRRLQHGDRIAATLPIDVCVPAPGQGIIAVEVRRDDARTREAVECIDDAMSAAALRAERAVVLRLGGGCQMPLGAHAEIMGDEIVVRSIVIAVDGSRVARATVRGATARPDTAGVEAAELLLKDGAGEILAEVQRAQAGVEGLRR